MGSRIRYKEHPHVIRKTSCRAGQGRGSSAVINQSLVGVVLEARRFQNVKPVCGAHHRVLWIKRTGFYLAACELLRLEALVGKTRTMEDEFISASGTDVTAVFHRYLRPLLSSDMPGAHRLRNDPVAKVLRT